MCGNVELSSHDCRRKIHQGRLRHSDLRCVGWHLQEADCTLSLSHCVVFTRTRIETDVTSVSVNPDLRSSYGLASSTSKMWRSYLMNSLCVSLSRNLLLICLQSVRIFIETWLNCLVVHEVKRSQLFVAV